ncbi:thermonuclease family protein [Bacillus mycoides]|uniref:Nuclease (SNase domain protein) n=1 Tax=Bacillus mycoides (strain KBAB4) TaxID=315730 RepID=A9VUY6_BACMK|nr:nuclease [Bacillus mycoides]ABY46707.1 nuclease (SNase domain protein) [Bacillus mycoides KBAB4]
MKEKILITSLTRVRKNAPWRVGIYINEGYTFINVGDKGNIATSPRFNIFLSEVEKKVSRYPVDVSFYSIEDNREMEVTMMRDQIIYIDCGYNSHRLLSSARFYYEKHVLSNPLELAQQKPEENNGLFNVMEKHEESITSSDYIAVGRVEKVTDGDTIDVNLIKLSDYLSKHFKVNQTVTIRYNGVDTPEKAQLGAEKYKDPKNAKFGKTYGVTMQDMYTIGEEAYKYNETILGGSASQKPLVIIHFDRNKSGDPPKQDAGYGRYIADIYATNEKSADIVFDKVKDGTKFVHVNKSLLVKKSAKFPQIPLGLFPFGYANTATVLNPLNWIIELGLKAYDTGTGSPSKDPNSDPDIGSPEPYDENINEQEINIGGTTGPTHNALDFFGPYDDRLSVFTNGIKTIDDLKRHSKVRIGDVILTIPPISIEVNKTANISKIKTLRTKSSVLVNRGQSLTTLSMDLYFHDIESINGKKYPWKKEYAKGEEAKHFYVDGLRPLLAQFAKAPFLPIDNYYINDVLGIRDVALMNIEVTTVPNFPESLTAKLTLVEFNSEAYLMDKSTLGDSINYPMLRWYYNQSLAGRGDKYRFFKGLEGPIKSDIKFTLADETFLATRKHAIDYMKNADSPEQRKVELETKNTDYKNRKEDASVVKEILDQYYRYKDFDIKKHTIIDYFSKPGLDKASTSIQGLIRDKYKIKKEEAENAIVEAGELFSNIYDNKYKDVNTILMHKEIFLPYESRLFYKIRFDWNFLESFNNRYDEDPSVVYDKKQYQGKEKDGLIILKKLKDAGSQKILENKFKEFYEKETFRIPANDTAIDALKKIAEGAKKMEEEVAKYKGEFDEYMKVIEASERMIPMKEYPISGKVIPISINARFSNEFSMAHVLSSEAASLQYMGGGDPYIDLILEVDESGARDFNNLISTSDYYAKTYNQGITNGYIGIENDLAQLFGIRYVMFESISVNTVPSFPGRYQIMLQGIAFDKTQRQREELTALPGNSKQMDLETLKNNKTAFANDRMIEARLHKLEVYPDMELPTYSQINDVLPEIDAGAKEYPNLTGGTYLDPDFYFSTGNTLRQLIESSYQGNHQVNMFDATGVAAYTSNMSTDKLFDTTEEDWEKLKALQETEGVEPIGWVFKWGQEQEAAKSDTPNTSAGPVMADQGGTASVKNADVQKFLTEKKDDEFAYETFPTMEEWKTLFPDGGNDYSTLAKDPSGDEALIYQEIDSLVDKYFKKYYSFPDFIEECRGDLKDADKSKKLVSYQPAEDLYYASFNANRNKLHDANIGMVSDLIKKGTIKEPKKTDRMDSKDFHKTEVKITKERFMTLMKAFLDKTSQWKHFKGKIPTVSKAGRVGIAQVDVSSGDMKVDEVKRLMYNWRYNLQTAVKQLAEHYEKLNKLDKDCENFEVICRPWDGMFALYEKPDAKIKFAKDIEDNSFASGVISRFNHYATKPFNTFSGYNKDVYKGKANLSMDEYITIGNGNKDDYVDKLLELEYYDLSVLKENKLKVDSDKKNIKKVMKEHLEKMDKDELFSTYQKHLKFLYELSKQDSKIEKTVDFFGKWSLPNLVTWGKAGKMVDKATDVIAGSKKDKNGYEYSRKIFEKAAKLYESIIDVDKTATASTESTDTRLYNDVDPRVLYEEMFYDLRYHDQRGRMLRAFPGFQMFIIHEGDYFGKYKFWDNMYGFNAIQSIDVHRSRKIAADTAVISMTNVYSNLTTRRTDVDYADREMKWWDNYIWNEIPQDLIDKKENEIHKNLFLETGARIHLRMGYGATASDLPIVFNGTISELELGDVIEIVAQGDGIELGNVVSGDPEDTNDGLFQVTEPRDLICSLMSSKGSWAKDFMNGVVDERLFKDNPLGIMHFGQPFDSNGSIDSKPLGNLVWFNDNYGEVAQNIYSSNGTPTFSQWLHPNGERNNIFEDFSWKRLWDNKFKIFNPGDEDNVVLKLYNNTVWDIIQSITYSTPDYIAAVHPFELRSTLFFGKPYWRCAFEYGSRYEFEAADKTWKRYLTSQPKRPYMQNKFYMSAYDIIENNIKASEDNIFTNVIVNYDGKQTPVLYADADIRYDKQKTRVVEADIVAKFGDFYTSEVMATHFGHSTLRDSMKDMYKGNLLVLGDPTAKPHDMMYINDEINDLQGNALIKSVTHHFSMETGFITSIEPDLLVVNDDQVILEMSKWYMSFGQSVAATLAIRAAANKAGRNMTKWITKSNSIPAKVGKWVSTKGLRHTVRMANSDGDMDKILKTLDDIISKEDGDVKALQQKLAKDFEEAAQKVTKEVGEEAGKAAGKAAGKTAGKTAFIKNTSKQALLKSGAAFAKVLSNSDDIAKIGKGAVGIIRGAASFTPVGLIVNASIWIGTEMLFEHYRRFKENLQCVVAMPLTYRGKELTAGINNHAGMIYGDAPGRYDVMFNAKFGDDNGEDFFGSSLIKLANFFTGSGGEDGVYAKTEKARQLNELSKKQQQ